MVFVYAALQRTGHFSRVKPHHHPQTAGIWNITPPNPECRSSFDIKWMNGWDEDNFKVLISLNET